MQVGIQYGTEWRNVLLHWLKSEVPGREKSSGKREDGRDGDGLGDVQMR